ncbi:MAG: glycosyltransferase family 4 protein [Xenococcaceae cyanobacterium MO_188.B32]|nr:glycosyltransferase family 4 protein [Xenococcaceae cyanobacterium MO_188.B32]
MKILLIVHYQFNPDSGAAGVTWKLGQYYQQLGHQVRYYSLDNLPNWLPQLAKIILFPWFVALHIRKLANCEDLDVVDSSTGDTWVWSKIGKYISKNHPLIVARDHGLDHIEHREFLKDVKLGKRPMSWKYPLYRGSIRLWEEATSLRHADLVLLLNRFTLEYAVNNLGVEKQKTQIIINGIPEDFLNLPYEPLDIDRNPTIGIAQVGTYIPRKGIQYSVPALNKILARYPQVRVTFLGTQCLECPDVERVYADFNPNLRDRVTVIPRYPHHQLPTLLQGHQIKLFPSTCEAFGMALVEAMACGLAPIVSATPGPMEIVTHEQNGIIIPSRSSDAIETALDKLITDYVYLESLRKNAYNSAQKYSWMDIARDTLNLYQKAVV